MISREQRASLKRQIDLGRSALERPEPLTCSAWADENFYLSPESSYSEGRWESLPFQVAILNMMGNDDIRVVNLAKSARVGYTSMMMASVGYHLEHKKRNQVIFQPKNADAADFMKDSIETMVRDVPVVRHLAHWFEKKHRDSTKERKVFSNQRQLYCRGGEAARNYRRLSADIVYYDELSSFDEDVEREGSPTWLGDKRVEGSVFGKSVRGSTPKIRGQCQIESACDEADESFRRYVPCPHCDEMQALEFGGSDADYGLKWKSGPEDVHYVCRECSGRIGYEKLYDLDAAGEWRSDSGMVTTDGILFFRDGKPVDTPERVAVHVWAIYNPFTTWDKIVRDFLKAKDNPIKLKTWVNTTAGETWEDETSKEFDWQILFARREQYRFPNDVVYLTCGADVQDDRFEWEVIGWGRDEQSWSLDYQVLVGNPAQSVLWDILAEKLRQQYRRDDGMLFSIGTVCIDAMGHFTDEVYEFSRKNGLLQFIPIQGANKPGKPIATFPVKRNRKGVYLVDVGTDNAKDLIYQRLLIQAQEDGVFPPGYCHFPARETHGAEFFRQLTAEKKVQRRSRGQLVYRWECPSGRRNEGLDCRVYGLAALRVAQQRKGIHLPTLEPKQQPAPQKRRRRVISRGVEA